MREAMSLLVVSEKDGIIFRFKSSSIPQKGDVINHSGTSYEVLRREFTTDDENELCADIEIVVDY